MFSKVFFLIKMEIYCVKERKRTPSVPGSEGYEKASYVESKMCKLWNNKKQICT